MSTGVPLGNVPPTVPVVDKYPVLIYSDLATVVTAAVESHLYTNKIDWKSCGIYGLVGIVSRYIEKFIAEQNSSQKFFSNDYRQQKNQLIVFVINAMLHSGSSKGMVMHGLKGVNADLLGKWLVDSIGDDKSVFSM